MRLVSLRSDGYRLLNNIDVTFPDGVIGVLGLNGSGKTSLLEAIAFALYGSSALRTTKEDILPPTGGDANIEFVFALGSHRYRITRELIRKSTAQKAKMWRDDETDPIANGVEAVTSEVTRMIGGRHELEISRFVAQKQVDALSQKDPTPRKQLILKLLGIEEIDSGIKNLRERRNEFDRTIKARQAILPNITDIRAQISALEAEERARRLTLRNAEAVQVSANETKLAAEEALVAMETNAESAAQHAASLHLFDESIAGLDRDTTALTEREAELTGAAERLAEVEVLVAAAQAHHDDYVACEAAAALRGKLSELRATAAALDGKLNTARARVAELSALAERREALEASQREAEAAISDATAEHGSAETERNAARDTLTRLRAERARITTQIAGLGSSDAASDVCPTCAQKLTDPTAFRAHLDERLTELTSEEQQVTNAGVAAKQRSDDATERISKLRSRLTTISADINAAAGAAGELRLATGQVSELVEQRERVGEQISEADAVEYDAEQHATLAVEAAALPSLLTLRAELSGQLRSRDQVRGDLAKVAASRAEMEAKKVEAREAAAKAGYDPDAHEAAKAVADSARTAAAAAAVAASELRGEVRLLEERLAGARRDLATHDRLIAEIDEILRQRGLVELTRETMERLKINLISRTRPALSRKGSVLIRAMTDGRYSELSLDTDYKISVGNPGAMRPVEGLSGGESDLANLCLRLAISELITETTGVGSSFVVLDEVLGSQDPERRDAIMTALPNLLGHFGQVLMISHDPAVQDRFMHAIWVTHDPASGTSSAVFPAPLPAAAAA